MGGAWERLVGAVKYALEGLEVPRTPREEVLRRALSNAERLVNSRPLTEIPVDPEEEECLTPNHFLLGSSNGMKPMMDMDDWCPTRHLADWKIIVKSFWTRWLKEYLPTISSRTKWRFKKDPLQVGDLVFLCDYNTRAGWRRGEVIAVHLDKESAQVRQVVVRTADGKNYRRAASKVAKIIRPDSPPSSDHATESPSSLKDSVAPQIQGESS